MCTLVDERRFILFFTVPPFDIFFSLLYFVRTYVLRVIDGEDGVQRPPSLALLWHSAGNESKTCWVLHPAGDIRI